MGTWIAKTAAADRFLSVAKQRPSETLIALDFDGTLAPIVDDPETSRLLPAAAAALARLGGRVRLAIITGRAVATVRRLGELDHRAGLEDLIVLGEYGSQRWDARTGPEAPPEQPKAVTAALEELGAAIEHLGLTGIFLEDKGRGIAVHTRRAAQPAKAYAQLQPVVADVAARHGLQVEPGRNVLELRTSTSNKGEALLGLVAKLGVTAVAMCGDDLGDLPAFDALSNLAEHGLATCAVVSVSAEQPSMVERADVAAKGPEGVAAWLEAVADAVG